MNSPFIKSSFAFIYYSATSFVASYLTSFSEFLVSLFIQYSMKSRNQKQNGLFGTTSCLKDSLPKSREHKFDREQRGCILAIEDWIYLDHIHRDQVVHFGYHFHSQLGFAVGQTTTHRRANSGCFFGIQRVHVKAQMNAVIELTSNG